MRVFIAVNFPEQVKKRLALIQRELRAQFGRGNFTRLENLHLTLSFIGEVRPEAIAGITAAMNELAYEPIEFSLSGFGTFGRRGDILWMGLRESSALCDVYEQLSAALERAGYPRESRKFSPHLTLAREVAKKSAFDIGEFAERIGAIDCRADAVSLMCSERVNGALVYREIYSKKSNADNR